MKLEDEKEENESAMTSIAIVIVNYNTTEETLSCINSIKGASLDKINLQIIVVDNSDREPLREIDSVCILRPGYNIGLSSAWYLAYKQIEETSVDYIMFINSDVQVSQEFFAELAKGIQRWGKNCMFGGRIYRRDSPDVIWSRGGVVDARKVVVRHDDCDVHKNTVKQGDFETGHISGCCMIIPFSLLEKSGGPDPDFFFRGEEWDLNYRVQQAGGRLVILDKMELWHAVNASHNRFAPDMLYLAYRAKVLFARKHHSLLWFPLWFMTGFIYAATIAPSKFARLSGQSKGSIRKALILAMIDGLRWKKILPRSDLSSVNK